MKKILLSLCMVTPLIIIIMGRYRPHGLITIFAIFLFVIGVPMLMYCLSVYIVDRGIKIPSYTSYDEIVRIRHSLEDKWRNK